MAIEYRKMNSDDHLYDVYTPEQIATLLPLIPEVFLKSFRIRFTYEHWKMLYDDMRLADPSTLVYRWLFELRKVEVLSDLWRLLFKTPLEDMPLNVNDNVYSSIVYWRLSIAK
jgi:hypothetical protein